MKKPSSFAVAITALWVVYGLVTTYVFYQTMEPLQRELVGILGGFALVVVVASAPLFTPKRQNRVSTDDSPGSADARQGSRTATPNKDPTSAGKSVTSCALVRPTRQDRAALTVLAD